MKTTCKSAESIFPARQLTINWLKYPHISQLADFCTSVISRIFWQYNWRILLNTTTLQDRYSIGWFIRGTGFLAVVRFGSSPTPFPPYSPISKLGRRRHTRILRKRENLLTGRGGGKGVRGAELYDCKKSLSSINHSVLSVWGDARNGSARYDYVSCS